MTNPTLRHLITFAALVAVADCSNPFKPDGPAIAVSFEVPAAAGRAYVLRNDIGDCRVELPADLAHNWHASTDIRGNQYGSVPVRATLLTPSGDSVAAVSFSQQFQSGYQHWVAALVATRRPIGMCIGMVSATPLVAGGPDTLFVLHGSIPEGAIC